MQRRGHKALSFVVESLLLVILTLIPFPASTIRQKCHLYPCWSYISNSVYENSNVNRKFSLLWASCRNSPFWLCNRWIINSVFLFFEQQEDIWCKQSGKYEINQWILSYVWQQRGNKVCPICYLRCKYSQNTKIGNNGQKNINSR